MHSQDERAQLQFTAWLTAKILIAAVTFIGSGVFAVVGSIAPSAATSGAHFTALDVQRSEFDGDGHHDDLTVTFTEVGVGNSSDGISVTVDREVSGVCVSATGETEVRPFRIYSRLTLTAGDPTDTRLVDVATDGNGKVTGTARFPTNPYDDLCVIESSQLEGDDDLAAEIHIDYPYESENDNPEHYVVTDYSVTYSNVFVQDVNTDARVAAAGPWVYSSGGEIYASPVDS